METVQNKIEKFLSQPVGTTVKPDQLGLPDVGNSMISGITIVITNKGNGVEVNLNWKGKALLLGAPGISLKNDPAIAIISNNSGGGLLIKTNDVFYKNAPLELTLNGNNYKIKGMTVSYSF